ncbi:MAG: flagellar motor switch protein FliG [bacterium]|nr:flagellar motor switch protein FliG [bacterium]
MATQTKNGRLIHAYRVAAISPEATPSPWSPPRLKTHPPASKLEMRLAPERASSETRERKQSDTNLQSQSPNPISPDESLEQIAARRPADVARAIRTLFIQEGDQPSDPPADWKAAVVFIGLGPDLASRVIRHCRREAERIAKAIAECHSVTAREKDTVFEEFKALLVSGDYLLLGGTEYAHQILSRAFHRRGPIIMDRAMGSETDGFQMLQNVDPNHIIPFIAKEHPQTIALILSQLSPNQSAQVLNGLEAELQQNVAYRIARLDRISPNVLEELQTDLSQELQAVLSGKIATIGGPKAVTNILNQANRTTEKAVMDFLDTQDKDLAEAVRNQMFVFEDIRHLTDREIQVLLKEIDVDDLALALKDASEELKNRLLSNVSEEVKKTLDEKIQFSGPVRTSLVEDKQLNIVQQARQLEEAGQITVVRSAEDDTFIQ